MPALVAVPLALAPADLLGGLSLLGNPWLDLGLLLLAGAAAGVVNTMAGGGGFLMLPVLVGLGLPATTANGTMRVAVLAQCATAVATFHRREIRPYKVAAKLAPAMVVGALLGSWLATRIDDQLFRPLVGALLLAWAVLLLFKPDRFLNPPEQPRAPGLLTQLSAVLVGVYGGFLQAGVGFPLIALLSGHLGHELVRANAIKVGVVLAFTSVALVVFALAGQVAWVPAAVLTAGTVAGAWLGARWQIDKGAQVVRYFVLVTVAVAGAAMLRSAFG